MAEHDPHSSGFFASLKSLAASVIELVRAFGGKGPIAAPVAPPVSAHSDVASAPLGLPAPEAHSEDAQLLTQHTPGWHVPHPSRLPVPTYAPAMTAFGIVFIALGAVTVWPLSVAGAAIFVLAIAKWIGELLHD